MKLHAITFLGLSSLLVACSGDITAIGSELAATGTGGADAGSTEKPEAGTTPVGEDGGTPDGSASSCGGTVASTSSGASADCNATITPFSYRFDPGQGMVSTDVASGRQVVFSLGSSATTVGETYSLTAQSATSDQATLTYSEAPIAGTAVGGVPLFGETWTSTSGTLTVTAVSSCFVSFTFDAYLSPSGTSSKSTGTFTMSGSVKHSLQSCGTVAATFAYVTGNANAAALTISGPEVSNTDFDVFGSYFPTPNLNEPREIQIQLSAPVTAGQSYSLSSTATATTASLLYLQSDNGTYGVDECWLATSGTLSVSSTESCELSFTVTGATMSPVPQQGATVCNGLNDATGSFTMSVTGTGNGFSQ